MLIAVIVIDNVMCIFMYVWTRENDFNFFSIRFVRSYKIEIHSLIQSFIYSFILYRFLYKIMPPKLKIKNPTNDCVINGDAATATESQFLSSLSPLEQRVCAIAESHLESSFDLSRSSGYIAWKAKNI